MDIKSDVFRDIKSWDVRKKANEMRKHTKKTTKSEYGGTLRIITTRVIKMPTIG